MKSIQELNIKRLIIVAYRLPFKIEKKGRITKIIQNSGGLVSSILSLSEKINNNSKEVAKIIWVGTGDESITTAKTNPNFELHPVIIPEQINNKYYGGFCNDTLWPLFHYFPSITMYDASYFEAYQTANQLFMDKLKTIIQPGDFIWIHDYQLFLLPGLIRSQFPKINSGFFLHIPFPSFEIFRLLPRLWRDSIIKGITGADIIGFHTSDYNQHFMKSVKRTLGNDINQNLIYFDDRVCKSDAFPIGIDYDKFNKACTHSKVLEHKENFKKVLSGQKLIFSVDRLDYTKGLQNRLKAYELFLEKYPAWHQKAVFNMVVVPSRDTIERYALIKKDIEAIVGRINGKYSNLKWNPIIYQYKSLEFEEMVALYNVSHVGLITPMRDGMNLVAKEYIACQTDHKGVLILSEMTGAASELQEAIIITPTDIQETADAIDKALSMSTKEKDTRVNKMQQRLIRYNVFTWALDFLNQAELIKTEQKQLSVNYINSTANLKIHDNYLNAKKRIILFDYDGTLIPLAKTPEMGQLNDKAATMIRKLTKDSSNNIIIISGRDFKFLERQFDDFNVTLIAEHGFFIRHLGEAWKSNNNINLLWKEKVLPILNEYVDRCFGSMVEEKHASICWHYRNAEPDIVSVRINELKDDLTDILKNQPKLQVLEGKMVLEIKSALYDKGTIVTDLLKDENYDFIMAIGDDKTDEDLFETIPDYGYTIKIGSTPSKAKFNLKKQNEIYEFINTLDQMQVKL